MSSLSLNLWLRIGASLIFAFGLMMGPNLRTSEILAEDASHERASSLHHGVADLIRRGESSRISRACDPCGQFLHCGTLRGLRCLTRLAASASGHLHGHRWANGFLAPPLL